MEATSDLRDGTAADIGDTPPAASSASIAAAAGKDGLGAVPSSRWRHFQFGELVPGGPGQCFHAIDTSALEDVILRVTPLDAATEARRGAWILLQDMQAAWMVDLVEAMEEQGRRYEVTRVPPPMTLREWVSCRQAGFFEVEALVRQLGVALATLHKNGVVHLNLRPDTIHVVSAEGDLQVQLGGFEFATLYDQEQPVAVPTDPLYAPPEAAGQAAHSPGRSLCAWDWWSLGRVVQEFVLGRHVLNFVLQRDGAQAAEALRAQAEALLLENGTFPQRAGAVEAMPSTDPAVAVLLHGLLASARDGRWGARQVQRWLERQPVKERYQHARDEHFYLRQDEIYTMAEAAEFFREAVHWAEGEASLFQADDPATLAHFIATEPAQRTLYEQLTELFGLSGMPEWRPLPQSARHTALAAMAWQLMMGPAALLTVRGRRINRDELQELLPKESDGPALIRALVTPAYVRWVEKTDADAAGVLSEAGALQAEIVRQAVQNGWVAAEDDTAATEILGLAFAPPRALAQAYHRVRERFAGTHDPRTKSLLEASASERGAQVLLAYAEAHPQRFGLLTHEEWNRERYEELRKTGKALGKVLFWLQLGQALAANSWLFGSWRKLVVGSASLVAITGAIEWWSGGRGWTLPCLAALPIALRLGFCVWFRRAHPLAVPWSWHDGRERCEAEARSAASAEEAARPAGEIRTQFAGINTEIAALALQPPPEPLPPPRRFAVAWAAALAGWLSVAVMSGAIVRSGLRVLHSLAPFPRGTAFQSDTAKGHPVGAAEPYPANADWSFGDPRRPRVAWNLSPPGILPALAAEKVVPATPDQVAWALVEGERELLPYLRHTVKDLIAVPVSAGVATGLILFDARWGTVAERQVYWVKRLPRKQSWFKLADHQAVFLGTTAE